RQDCRARAEIEDLHWDVSCGGTAILASHRNPQQRAESKPCFHRGQTTMQKINNLVRGALLATLVACLPAQAAEIVLERTAVDRLVQQALFTDQGRYFLQRGACYAYLDHPAVTLTGGRVVLNANLTSYMGVIVGTQCVGVPLNSKVTASGRPVHQ